MTYDTHILFFPSNAFWLPPGRSHAFIQAIIRIMQDKQNHPVIAQMIRPGVSDDLPPAESAAHRVAVARSPAQPHAHFQ